MRKLYKRTFFSFSPTLFLHAAVLQLMSFLLHSSTYLLFFRVNKVKFLMFFWEQFFPLHATYFSAYICFSASPPSYTWNPDQLFVTLPSFPEPSFPFRPSLHRQSTIVPKVRICNIEWHLRHNLEKTGRLGKKQFSAVNYYFTVTYNVHAKFLKFYISW